MTQTCTGTINITTPPPGGCTPNWQCEQPLNGYESDGCGNRRLNSVCDAPPTYRPADITACTLLGTPNVAPGQTITFDLVVAGGSVTELYYVEVSGLAGNQAQQIGSITVLADMAQEFFLNFIIPYYITPGSRTYTIILTKL